MSKAMKKLMSEMSGSNTKTRTLEGILRSKGYPITCHVEDGWATRAEVNPHATGNQAHSVSCSWPPGQGYAETALCNRAGNLIYPGQMDGADPELDYEDVMGHGSKEDILDEVERLCMYFRTTTHPHHLTTHQWPYLPYSYSLPARPSDNLEEWRTWVDVVKGTPSPLPGPGYGGQW